VAPRMATTKRGALSRFQRSSRDGSVALTSVRSASKNLRWGSYKAHRGRMAQTGALRSKKRRALGGGPRRPPRAGKSVIRLGKEKGRERSLKGRGHCSLMAAPKVAAQGVQDGSPGEVRSRLIGRC